MMPGPQVLELSRVCVVDAIGHIIREAKVASEPDVLTPATSVAGVTLPFDTTLTDGHPGGRVTADEDTRLLVRQRCAIRVRFGWASVRCSVTIWPAMPQPCMSDLAGPAESKPGRPETMTTISWAAISSWQWAHD